MKCNMFKVEKVSIFSKFIIINNVLRATSFLPLVTLFLIKNVNYRNESKNTLAFIYLLVFLHCLFAF